LRERKKDIPLMIGHFLARFSERMDKQVRTIEEAAMNQLLKYSWPGNVRELQNVIERAVILGRESGLHFDLGGLPDGEQGLERRAPLPIITEGLTLADLKQMEKELILRALEGAGWRISGEDGAAAQLGLKPTTLTSRLKKLGLQRPAR
jgi:formate hydrogenlyase transcriptional activator